LGTTLHWVVYGKVRHKKPKKDALLNVGEGNITQRKSAGRIGKKGCIPPAYGANQIIKKDPIQEKKMVKPPVYGKKRVL